MHPSPWPQTRPPARAVPRRAVPRRVERRQEAWHHERLIILAALLRTRFGHRPQTGALTRYLAEWPEERAIGAIEQTQDFDDLLALVPHTAR